MESARRQIELLGPVAADNSSALHKALGFGVEHFELDFEQQQARCPQGQWAIRWHQQTTKPCRQPAPGDGGD